MSGCLQINVQACKNGYTIHQFKSYLMLKSLLHDFYCFKQTILQHIEYVEANTKSVKYKKIHSTKIMDIINNE